MKRQWCLVQDKCCMYVCHCSYFITIATTTTVTFTGTKLLTFFISVVLQQHSEMQAPLFYLRGDFAEKVEIACARPNSPRGRITRLPLPGAPAFSTGPGSH